MGPEGPLEQDAHVNHRKLAPRLAPIAAFLAATCAPADARITLAPTTASVAREDLEGLADKYRAPGATLQQKGWLVTQIAAVGDDAARDFLTDRFFDETDKALRRAIFDALSGPLGPPASRVTRQTAADPDPYLRSRTLRRLELADPAAAEAQARSVVRYDEDPRVRRTAIRCLAARAEVGAARYAADTAADLTWADQRVAIEALSKLPDAVFAAAFRDDLGWAKPDADPARRLLTALIVAARGAAADESTLKALSKDKDARVQFAASLGLDRVDGKGRATAMKRALGRAKGADDRCALLDVARRAGIADDGLAALLVDDLGHRDWRVRAAAADALAETAPAAALKELTGRAADDGVWQVRVAAIRALGFTRAADAVAFLVARMEDRTGRERHAIRQALTRLTGVDMGDLASSWALWWQGEATSFAAPDADEALFADLAKDADRYAFYGLEVHSDRVAFVLDTSGSMQGKRIASLKEQLERILAALPERAWINFLFFSSGVDAWQEKLKPLTPANRNAALSRVRYLEANGGTNFHAGVMAAFDDEDVDTIYILSDGEPTAGEVTSMPAICRRVEERNRHRRVAIHVVMIGYESPELRRLAIDSGGSYAVFQ